ncbi:hypothetical protein ES702_02869 [subsurface metagenome]
MLSPGAQYGIENHWSGELSLIHISDERVLCFPSLLTQHRMRVTLLPAVVLPSDIIGPHFERIKYYLEYSSTYSNRTERHVEIRWERDSAELQNCFN